MAFRGAILASLLIVSASAAVAPTLRLDDSVRPARYEAELTLATDAPTFSGAIDIDVELRRPALIAGMVERGRSQFLGGPRTSAQMIEWIRLCEARVETQRADVARFLAAE